MGGTPWLAAARWVSRCGVLPENHRVRLEVDAVVPVVPERRARALAVVHRAPEARSAGPRESGREVLHRGFVLHPRPCIAQRPPAGVLVEVQQVLPDRELPSLGGVPLVSALLDAVFGLSGQLDRRR